MKSEQKLKLSYNKQKLLFEEAKEKKISNLRKREEEISQKIEKLQRQLHETQQQEQKELARSFRDYEDFRQAAQQQSNSKRDPEN